jgi:hypothetical protein
MLAEMGSSSPPLLLRIGRLERLLMGQAAMADAWATVRESVEKVLAAAMAAKAKASAAAATQGTTGSTAEDTTQAGQPGTSTAGGSGPAGAGAPGGAGTADAAAAVQGVPPSAPVSTGGAALSMGGAVPEPIEDALMQVGNQLSKG